MLVYEAMRFVEHDAMSKIEKDKNNCSGVSFKKNLK